jgi:L-arabinose isomerase
VVSGMLHEDPAAWGDRGLVPRCRRRAPCEAAASAFGAHLSGDARHGSDFTSVSAQSGVHVEVLEMCDLDECVEQVSAGEVAGKIAVARQAFDLEDVSAGDWHGPRK